MIRYHPEKAGDGNETLNVDADKWIYLSRKEELREVPHPGNPRYSEIKDDGTHFQMHQCVSCISSEALHRHR